MAPKSTPLPPLPPDVAAMPPAMILVWLDTMAACECLSKSGRRKWRRAIRQTTEPVLVQKHVAQSLAGARVAMYPHVCSAWWAELIDAQLRRLGLLHEAPRQNMRAANTKRIYPPEVERKGVGMLRCRICGIPTPRPDCRSGVCGCCIEESILASRRRMGEGDYEG
jgi:hypothetical protein